MNTCARIQTYSQEIGFELDGPAQVREGRFGLSHGQEDRGPLVEGQVVLRVSLCKGQRLVTFTERRGFPRGDVGVKVDVVVERRHQCQRANVCQRV